MSPRDVDLACTVPAGKVGEDLRQILPAFQSYPTASNFPEPADVLGCRTSGTSRSSVDGGGPVGEAGCETGVYVVSLISSLDQNPAVPDGAPSNRCAVAQWLGRVPSLKLDGQLRPSPDEIVRRLGEFWLRDESVLYIGKPNQRLCDRVRQYYGTALGNSGPQRGGHWLKTLSVLEETFVHYMETPSPEESKNPLLGAFVSRVTSSAKQELKDPEHPFPFANLVFPKGTRKDHGLKGQAR